MTDRQQSILRTLRFYLFDVHGEKGEFQRTCEAIFVGKDTRYHAGTTQTPMRTHRLKIAGLVEQYATPDKSSPRIVAISSATPHMYKFVQNIKSYGFGFTPTFPRSAFNLFCTPAVTPSIKRDSNMNIMPIGVDVDVPPFCVVFTRHDVNTGLVGMAGEKKEEDAKKFYLTAVASA